MPYISSDKGRILVALEDVRSEDQIDKDLGTTDKDIVYQAVLERDVITPSRANNNPSIVRSGGAGTGMSTSAEQSAVEANLVMTGLKADQDLPEWNPWFVAANMEPSVEAGVGVTYEPAVYNDAGLTVYEYKDHVDAPTARLTKSTNVQGSWSISGALDEPITIQFSGIGDYYTPGKAETYYDSEGSLSVKEDGNTPFGSHDQFVTIASYEEGHTYRIMIDGEEFSYEASTGDNEDIVATELATLIGLGSAPVTATATDNEIKIEGATSGDRFHARIPRRDDKLTIFNRERWVDDKDLINAKQMQAVFDEFDVDIASFEISGNLTTEGVRVITGQTGLAGVVNSKPTSENIALTVELLDADEALYEEVLDRLEVDGYFTFDLRGENYNTNLEISADNLQFMFPEISSQGQYVGYTLSGIFVGQWGDEVGGGTDLSVSLTHK